MTKIAFIDLEIDGRGKILDIGGVKGESRFHSAGVSAFAEFISDCDCLCGHNIVEHDIKYLRPFLKKEYFLIDTLYFSPLLFPHRPYHKLLKDDKILTDELNNPLNDSLKAKALYEDEVSAFKTLDKDFLQLYYDLLGGDDHFSGFFRSIEYIPSRRSFFFRKTTTEESLSELLRGKICEYFDNTGIFTDECFRKMTVLDDAVYGSPSEVLLQLTHRDVVLDVFKGRGNLVGPLYSGTSLCVDENGLYHESYGRRRLVVKFSSAFRDKLSRLEAKGYSPVEAKVRFQVYWRYDESSGASPEPQWREVLVLLPDLLLRRSPVGLLPSAPDKRDIH